MGNKKHQFTLHGGRQYEYWRGVVSGLMYAFGNMTGERFSWIWGYDEDGWQSYTCKIECSEELFVKIKEYISQTIHTYIFEEDKNGSGE